MVLCFCLGPGTLVEPVPERRISLYRVQGVGTLGLSALVTVSATATQNFIHLVIDLVVIQSRAVTTSSMGPGATT